VTTLIALLRGINVGGHYKLPMQDLRTMLSGLGCDDVKTYIDPFPEAVDDPKSLHVAFLAEPARPHTLRRSMH
jgi:uncharacterized protein (DUF1697 family)